MKKFLAICLVLVLVLAIALPTAVSAGSSDNANVGGTVLAAPSLSSITNGSGTPNLTGGGPKGITDVEINGTGFSTDPTANVTVNVSPATGITTSVTAVTATKVTATFTLAAGTGTPAGDRTVTVTQGGVTSSTTVTFTVGGYINVTAPQGITLGVINLLGTVTGSSTAGNAGAVDTNESTYSVSAKDANAGGNSGHMVSGGNALANELMIKATSGGGYSQSDATHGITYSSQTSLPFYVSQQGDAGDVAGSYSITITFTGSY
jgi:hypothetical protein